MVGSPVRYLPCSSLYVRCLIAGETRVIAAIEKLCYSSHFVDENHTRSTTMK